MNGRLKSLLRLALAEQAFQEADAIIDHILSHKFDPDSHLYQSCVGGLVVSYCRPQLKKCDLLKALRTCKSGGVALSTIATELNQSVERLYLILMILISSLALLEQKLKKPTLNTKRLFQLYDRCWLHKDSLFWKIS